MPTFRALRLAMVMPFFMALAIASKGAAASEYEERVLHPFQPNNNAIGDSLYRDSSGTFYGGSGGGVFSFTPAAKHRWTYKLLYKFGKREDGAGPLGAFPDTAGNLYGVTIDGGTQGGGTAFKLTPNLPKKGWKETILYNFANVSLPRANLTYAGAASGLPYDGVSPLYGTTSQGGGGAGTVFSLAPGDHGWVYTDLHDFGSVQNDGYYPFGGLIVDGNGNLFGAASMGGANGGGVVFELSPTQGKTSWTYSILYSFCSLSHCNDGARPAHSLVMDNVGNIFGVTTGGGKPCTKYYGCNGVAYKLTPNGTHYDYTLLYNFCSKKNCVDGAHPNSALTLDSAGNLFGVTFQGGSNDVDSGGEGTVFEIANQTETVHYSFCAKANCLDGALPNTAVVLDSSGNLFGTTQNGGIKASGGTIFELSP